jgi:hypothetical protein
MTTAPARFGDPRVRFGDPRVDWAGNWLEEQPEEPPSGSPGILRPPTVAGTPVYNPAITQAQRFANRLARYLPGVPAELNVYRLTDGSYTTDQPPTADEIDHVFLGGHVNEVSGTERLALEAAGFTVDDLPT